MKRQLINECNRDVLFIKKDTSNKNDIDEEKEKNLRKKKIEKDIWSKDG